MNLFLRTGRNFEADALVAQFHWRAFSRGGKCKASRLKLAALAYPKPDATP